MRLTQVDIRNFRSIADISIPFDPSCRILVGINESGKSNILRALALLDPERETAPGDLREFGPRENPDQDAYVDFVFAFDADERRDAHDRLMKKLLCANPDVPLLRRAHKPLTLIDVLNLKPEMIHRVDIRTGDRTSFPYDFERDFAVAPGWSRVVGGKGVMVERDGESVPLNSFLMIHDSAAEGIPAEHVRKATIGDIYSAFIVAYAHPMSNQLPPCVYWSFDESNLLPAQVDLNQFAATPSSCQPLRNMFALAGLPNARSAIEEAKERPNGIKNLLNRVASRATRHMHQVWKEYRGVTIDLAQNGANIDASIKDHYNHFDLSRRSDGFKRFLAFLLMVSARVRTRHLVNMLYLHDEPDVSLHPSGARYLRDELINIASYNYVVFSTHSIFMIDRELLGRHLIVRKRNEITQVEEANESNIVDEEVIYNALGYSIFESLQPANLLFEGWRDKRLFQVAIENVPIAYTKRIAPLRRVGVCHARGVKDIGRITPMLELARRQWVVVSDGDRPALEQQKQYTGAGPWVRYNEIVPEAITSEDFVRADAIRRATRRVVEERPTLPELTVDELAGPRARIEVLREWLGKGGLAGEEMKRALESIKEAVFADLTGKQVEARYFEFLAGLASRLG